MHVWCRLLSEWDLAYQLAYDIVLAIEVVYKNTKDWTAGDCTTETEYGYHGDASEPGERKHADIQALWEKKNHREKETVHLEMQNAITAANKGTLLQPAKWEKIMGEKGRDRRLEMRSNEKDWHQRWSWGQIYLVLRKTTDTWINYHLMSKSVCLHFILFVTAVPLYTLISVFSNLCHKAEWSLPSIWILFYGAHFKHMDPLNVPYFHFTR